MKVLMIPTWLLVNLMIPILPKTHPWKGKKFTLQDWTNGSTNITFSLSILLWGNFLSLLIVLTYLIIR